jgi:hypothetical protein
VGPRAGVDICGKFAATGIRSPGRPALSESLYRLSYPGPHALIKIKMSYVSLYIFPLKYIRCEFQSRWVQETCPDVGVKCPLFVSDFDQHPNVLIAFIKILRMSHFMKIAQSVSICIIRT